jgi:hypothetical protein
MSTRTAVVAASVAQKPRHGGHTWVVLQYLLGLRRIGFDVLLLDRLEPGMCRDADGELCRAEDSTNVRYLESVMESFALADCFALMTGEPRTIAGLPRTAAAEQVRQADLLLDVMGFFRDDDVAALAPFRAFLDIDPGFPQMWHALGLADTFSGYDAYVTIGERIGEDGCTIPTCGLSWITTPQPVVLEEWTMVRGDRGAFTSVVTWRGANEPLEFGGRRYGVRAHEFRRFARLPQLVDEPFELALDIHPADAADRSLLRDTGWRLVDPVAAAGDPWRYRDFVRSSKAELMVAKNMYVATNGGWVSDRTICYLASGRPAVVQDTGIVDRYRTDAGLLTFSTLEEASAAVEAVARDHDRHASGARALAEECFDSDRVLPRLVSNLGLAA